MGTSIVGWLEVRGATGWRAVANVGSLVGRSYNFYGSLFGVRNYAGYEPVAPNRGIPEDASPLVRSETAAHDPDAVGLPSGHTWLSLADVEAIDWDETTVLEDDEIHHPDVRSRGTTTRVFDRDGGYRGTLSDVDESLTDKQRERLFTHWELRTERYRYVVDRNARREARVLGWDLLVSWMRSESEARDLKPEAVRIVVWFT